MAFNKFIIIYISLFNIIISLKLNVNKKIFNISQLFKYNLLDDEHPSNSHLIRSLINLPIQQSELGLYLINITIGEPTQEFSLILDSGSSYIWVNDNNCNACKSKNKFISSKSNTFAKSKENINMNFISGNIKGNLCRDYFYFNSNINTSFYFLLVYESNIGFEIDGIIGLSKGSYNKKYSFLNQLKDKKIMKHNILLYDLYNKSFYIDEIPQIYLEQKSVSCKNKEDKTNFWKCDVNYLKVDDVVIRLESEIIFDSGTNGIVFPIKYKDYFENVIKNNQILQKGGCELKYFDNERIYQIICEQSLENIDLNGTENFLEFYFDKGQKNFFSIKLTDLFNENDKSFYLYIFERKSEILLGSPFFEKYPVLFNMDDNIINIFGVGNDLYKYKINYEYKIGNIQIVIIIVIFILIILILVRAQCVYRKRKSYNKIEFLVEERN